MRDILMIVIIIVPLGIMIWLIVLSLILSFIKFHFPKRKKDDTIFINLNPNEDCSGW